MTRMRLWAKCFGQEEASFITSYPQSHSDFSLLMLTMIPWLRWWLSGFSRVNLFFQYYALWKDVAMYHPLLRSRRLLPISFGMNSLHNVFGILLCRKIVSFPHLYICSIIYLHQYGHMDIYCIPVLWVII